MKMEKATLNVKNLPISTKHSIEICRFIRDMGLQKAKSVLANVVELKQAVPFVRHNMNVGHKAGMSSARFPTKASKHILDLLKSVEHNAIKDGLSKDLVISHISADKGVRQWHNGRQRRRKTKSTNIRIILEEFKRELPKKKKIKQDKE